MRNADTRDCVLFYINRVRVSRRSLLSVLCSLFSVICSPTTNKSHPSRERMALLLFCHLFLKIYSVLSEVGYYAVGHGCDLFSGQGAGAVREGQAHGYG